MMVPYTFIGPTSNSRIDHILYAAIGGTVLSCDIVDNHLNSDHVPLKVVFDFNVGHVDLVERPHIRQTAWWKASSCDIQEYRTRLDNKVDNFVYDNCIENCTDVMCTKHDIEISSMYNNVIQLCLEAAEDIPKTGQLTSNKRIPGWSEHVEHLRREALVWHHHWRACGQPHEGDVAERRRVSRTEYHRLWKLGGRARQEALYDLMRKSRLLFKYALRKCKRNKNAIVADNIAENVCKKDDKAFWRGIQNVTNSKVKLPSKIGEAHGSTDISVMWKDHYSRIFSTVNESNCTALYADLCDEHYLFETGMCVTPNEIADIVAEMSCNKSPGLDGLTSEHLKKANCQLSVLLSILLSALLVHGRVPSDILKSVMVPIVKNKNKRVSDKENYRPICLANVFT